MRVEALDWLGRKDLNPRNGGVRVRCLTTWRRPSNLTNDIIPHISALVKGFLEVFLFFSKKSAAAFIFQRRSIYHTKNIRRLYLYRRKFSQKISKGLEKCAALPIIYVSRNIAFVPRGLEGASLASPRTRQRPRRRRRAAPAAYKTSK